MRCARSSPTRWSRPVDSTRSVNRSVTGAAVIGCGHTLWSGLAGSVTLSGLPQPPSEAADTHSESLRRLSPSGAVFPVLAPWSGGGRGDPSSGLPVRRGLRLRHQAHAHTDHHAGRQPLRFSLQAAERLIGSPSNPRRRQEGTTTGAGALASYGRTAGWQIRLA